MKSAGKLITAQQIVCLLIALCWLIIEKGGNWKICDLHILCKDHILEVTYN